jgi:hypothetical protein
MFVRTAVVMPIGSPVLVDLVRPGLKKAIQVSGRVVNVTAGGAERGGTPGLGIAFDVLPVDVEDRLRELLGQLDPAVPKPATRIEPERPRATVRGVVGDRWLPPAGGTALPDDSVVANVKGLFEELSRAQAELLAKDQEIAMLKEEILRLRAERRKR